MKNRREIPSWLRPCLLGVAAVILLTAPLPIFAQSCSLCYTQAAASTARFIQALRSGIIILMVPPMLMSIGITVMAYQRRNTFNSSR
jgi:hypothetical protein